MANVRLKVDKFMRKILGMEEAKPIPYSEENIIELEGENRGKLRIFRGVGKNNFLIYRPWISVLTKEKALECFLRDFPDYSTGIFERTGVDVRGSFLLVGAKYQDCVFYLE